MTSRSVYLEGKKGRYAIYKKGVGGPAGVDCYLEVNATIFNFSLAWHEEDFVELRNEGYFPCFFDVEIVNVSNCEFWTPLNKSYSRACVGENRSFAISMCPNYTYTAYAEMKIKLLAGTGQPDPTIKVYAPGYDLPMNTTSPPGNWWAVYYGNDVITEFWLYKNQGDWFGVFYEPNFPRHCKTFYWDCFGDIWYASGRYLYNLSMFTTNPSRTTITLPEHNGDGQAFTVGPKYSSSGLLVYVYLHPHKIAEVFWDEPNETAEDIITYDVEVCPSQLYWDGSTNRILIAGPEKAVTLIPNSGGTIDCQVDSPGPLSFAARDIYGRYWFINHSGYEVYILTANLDFVEKREFSPLLRFSMITENSYNDIVIITRKRKPLQMGGVGCSHAMAFYADDDYSEFKILKTGPRCFTATTWHKEWVLIAPYCYHGQWFCEYVRGLNLRTGERIDLPVCTFPGLDFRDCIFWLWGDQGISKWRSWDWTWTPAYW